MVQLEIELLAPASKDEIYSLRNFLKEQLPDAEFLIKEQPPAPGQMSGSIAETIVMGVLHASSAILIEELYHNLLKPLLIKWKMTAENKHSQLEIMSSLSSGEEKIHVLENSKGETEVFNFKYAIDTDKTYALLIGVGTFKKDFHAIPPVKGNVEDLYKILTDKKHIGIPRQNITVSYDETHVEIQKQLLLASHRQDVQTLIIYFVGHGHRSDVKKLSLIAADTEKIGDDVIGGIDFDFISNKILKNSAARQKILILDTCHSGIATQGGDDIVADFDVKGSYILTSSPGDEVSYFEKNARNTYFTGALLDVLEHGIDNTSEMLALEDLYGYTKEILVEKNMPYPNAKNEMNIPPSQFFVARNPSFSGEKLKLRAYNLFRDGKLRDALDEYRSLLKRFPNDESLRKQFEECETELSFSILVHDANILFYQGRDYAKAGVLFKKAYSIKKDPMIMEKIRECEQPPLATSAPSLLDKVKSNENYIAFKKASERKAFFAALLYLKKVKLVFPSNSYVAEETALMENKLKDFEANRNDERLSNYYSYLNNGELLQAQEELKMLLQNDPEYPVFLKLQKALQVRIREEEKNNTEGKKPLLFRIYQSLSPSGKIIMLLLPVAIIAASIVFFVKENKEKDLSFLREMLKTDANRAIVLLNEKAVGDDSAKFVLGEYYIKKGDYSLAKGSLENAALPAAKSALGKLYLDKTTFGYADSAKADYFFNTALSLGHDSTASFNLGMIALNKYSAQKKINNYLWDFGNPTDWKNAVKYFANGYINGCYLCGNKLSVMYYDRANDLRDSLKYDDAYPFYLTAIEYGNSDAMCNLGLIFNNTGWAKNNIDSCKKWYLNGMQNNHALSYNNYACLFIDNGSAGSAFYDSAYKYLLKARELDPSLYYTYTNIGTIFEKGSMYIVPNEDSALYYYRIGMIKGSKKSKDAYERLTQKK